MLISDFLIPQQSFKQQTVFITDAGIVLMAWRLSVLVFSLVKILGLFMSFCTVDDEIFNVFDVYFKWFKNNF